VPPRAIRRVSRHRRHRFLGFFLGTLHISKLSAGCVNVPGEQTNIPAASREDAKNKLPAAIRKRKRVKMIRLNCPACGELFEDETDLGVTLKVVEHLKNIPETEHIVQLAAMLKELERLIALDKSASRAALNLDIRQEIFDRCARFDERLRTIQLLAVSTLTLAVDEVREILQECSDYLGIRDRNAGHSLLQNLNESLLVANRKFRN